MTLAASGPARWMARHWWIFPILGLLLVLMALHGTLPSVQAAPLVVQTSYAGRAICLADSGRIVGLTCERTGYPYGSRSLQGLPAVISIAILYRLVGIPGQDGVQILHSLYIVMGALSLIWWVHKASGSVMAGVFAAGLFYTSIFVLGSGALPAGYAGVLLFPFFVVSSLFLLESVHRALRAIQLGRLVLYSALQMAIAEMAILTSGYAYAMTVVAVGLAGVAAFVRSLWLSRRLDRTWLLVLLLYVPLLLLPGYAYQLLIFKRSAPPSPVSMDFFRGQGIDLITLLVPTQQMLLTKLLNLGASGWDPVAFYGNGGNANRNFPGYVAPLAVLVTVALAALGRIRGRSCILALGLVAAVGFMFSLGPSLKINDPRPAGSSSAGSQLWRMPEEEATLSLPTKALYRLPVIGTMRYAYRWQLMWRFALAALAGISVGNLLPQRKMLATVLCLGMLLEGLPASVLFYQKVYAEDRAMGNQFIVDVADPLSGYIQNSRVLFLPASNDYLVTFIAPYTRSYSYNVGGDKEMARIRNLEDERITETRTLYGDGLLRARDICMLFRQDLVDRVVFTYFSMSRDAWSWPPAQKGIDELRQRAEQVGLEDYPGLRSYEEELFIVVQPDTLDASCRAR